MPSELGLELWGGIECSRVRIRDRYVDQLEASRHDRHPADIERIAALGIRALRYPVLWEAAAPRTLADIDWRWADERLPRLARAGLRPIIGFVHHGSGPGYTSLVDPAFGAQLATFAQRFAERYPWIAAYTPVNEPLTTARFSGLYGHWHPHARDSFTFAQAMLNQCRGVALAMKAVREVRADAQLVQTEDLGRTASTPRLEYQADFENERRWLTFDLLCGRVDRRHPIGQFLLWLGIAERDLMWFAEHPCPPDILGINYYVTSERYLDERLERYPALCAGSNGRDSYVDVEAVRVLEEGIAGPCALLTKAWERYRLPLAITEAHLGCTREEQLRWLWYVWNDALAARAGGADVKGVTVWSLLGAFDWDSLMTLPRGHYEPGAFDIRGETRRETAVASLARQLAQGRTPTTPVLEQPGWWQRAERLLLPTRPSPGLAGRPLLISGARGTLGRAVARICQQRGLPTRCLSRSEMDIADAESVQRAIEQHDPWGIVNAAGYVRVNRAEADRERCQRDNTRGAQVLAAACQRHDLALLLFSSHLVFDGAQTTPYQEPDAANPLCVYGRSKATAERAALELYPAALVVRSGPFFGPWDDRNFVTASLEELSRGRHVLAASDVLISPTYLPDLIHASLDLLIDEAAGVWHLANEAELTWAEFARQAAGRAGLDTDLVSPLPSRSINLPALRPSYSVLGSRQSPRLPPLHDALTRYFAERIVPASAPPIEVGNLPDKTLVGAA